MIDDYRFLMKKAVDWSLLHQGFSIPIEYQPLVHASQTEPIKVGESRNVKILIDGELCDAVIKNQPFSRTRFGNRSDILQFRYNQTSRLATKLREIFQISNSYIDNVREVRGNAGGHIKMPDELNEYIALYATAQPNVYAIESFLADGVVEVNKEIQSMDEEEYENQPYMPQTDETARIVARTTVSKVRHLDRSIGDSLKHLYGYRCQMTGEKVGGEYDALVVEAHHIVPFTQSMNNDTSNIIILSPSYHRIIHKTNPEFNRETLSFIFPNGLIENVKIDKHLKIRSL